MNQDKKDFMKTLSVILGVIILFIGFGVMFILNKNTTIFKMISMVLLLLLIVYILSIGLSLFLLSRVEKRKNISKSSYKFIKAVMTSVYPLLIGVVKLFNKDKDSIRRVHANINNLLVMTNTKKTDKDSILILLPHCLQNDECTIKITNDIDNCKECGKCDIGDIKNLKEKYGINIVVATGGTLARQWIKKTKPKCIIAVACERDLSSGINDIKQIPVMGVLNERPNGPCFNTKIDIVKIEEAIELFLKEDEICTVQE